MALPTAKHKQIGKIHKNCRKESADADEVYLVYVRFHMDGTFTVVDRYAPDEDMHSTTTGTNAAAMHYGSTERTCSSSSGVKRPTQATQKRTNCKSWSTDGLDGHCHIALNGKERSRSLAYSDQVRAGVPADAVQSADDVTFPQSDGSLFTIKEVLLPDSSRVTTILCQMDASGSEIIAEFPIDEREIDATMPEMKEYAGLCYYNYDTGSPLPALLQP